MSNFPYYLQKNQQKQNSENNYTFYTIQQVYRILQTFYQSMLIQEKEFCSFNNINQYQQFKIIIKQPIQISKTIKYEAEIIVRFRKNLLSLNFTVLILNNGIPIKVNSKSLMLLLCRHLSFMNSNKNMYAFKLYPPSGEIRVNCQIKLTSNKYKSLTKDSNQVANLIKNIIGNLNNYIKLNLVKILEIIDQLPSNLNKISKYYHLDYKQIYEQELRQINQQIVKMINVSQYKFEFMKAENLNPKKISLIIQNNAQQKQIRKQVQQSNIINNQANQNKQTPENSSLKLTNNLNSYNQTQHHSNLIYAKLQLEQLNQQEDLSKYLILIICKYLNQQKSNVISQIQIKNQLGWEQLSHNGSSKIEKGAVQFTYVKQKHVKPIKKYLIKKSDKINNSNKNSKILREINILNHLADYECVHLAKFYFSNQKDFKNSLLIDFYAYHSLSSYRVVYKNIFSIYSKLYILCQVVQGMRFYRFHKIVHCDIKPGNILVGRNLIPRISDFGESIHPSQISKKNRPGFTIAYAAPQLLSIPDSNSEKIQQYIKSLCTKEIDTYSFGVMMYEIIFQKYPIQTTKQFQEKLMKNENHDYQHKILLLKEDLDKYGCPQVMQNLCRLCLKCMDPQQCKRPKLEWIVIILRFILKYLEDKI